MQGARLSQRAATALLYVGRTESVVDPSLTKTLTEIEGNDWGDPNFDSHLVATVHNLRHKPIGEFTVEDLRTTIGQSVGLPHLVQLAIANLGSDPLIEGDLYPGDLLSCVLRIADSFWNTHPALRDRLLHVAHVLRDIADDTDLVALCTSFESRWTP